MPGPDSLEEEPSLRKNLLQRSGVQFSMCQESFVGKKLDVWSLTLPLSLPDSAEKNLLKSTDKYLSDLIRSGFFAAESPGFTSTCLKDLAEA